MAGHGRPSLLGLAASLLLGAACHGPAPVAEAADDTVPDPRHAAGSGVEPEASAGGAWATLGEPLASNGARAVSLSLDAAQRLRVAWSDVTRHAVHVRIWDGAGWQELPGARGSEADAFEGVEGLAVGEVGRPLVAWSPSGRMGSVGVEVRQWGEGGWSSLPTPCPSPCFGPAEVRAWVDSAERPWVLWRNGDVFLRVFDAGTWSAVGAPLSAKAGFYSQATGPALALDSDGQPVVAWGEDENGETGGGPNRAHVARWSGSGWETLGGALTRGGGATSLVSTSLAIDAEGRPVVAWNEAAGEGSARTLQVARWEDGAWHFLGGPLGGRGSRNAFRSAVAAGPAGELLVAWEEVEGSSGEGEVHAARWTGADWQTLGAPIPGGRQPAVAFDASGAPLLTYGADDPSAPLRVLRWQ